jgi:N-acetylglutamate synthase-like GNAT family acetyltransferase
MEKMHFVVRKAALEDVPYIQTITREAFKMYLESAGINGTLPALQETCQDIIEDINSKECFVALLNGEVIGSVRVELREDGTAYLSRFGVEASQQSHGVGSILMNAVDEAMQQLGVSKLYLHTASKLLSLVRFYYGKGFYIDSTTKDRGYIRALLCKEYVSQSAELIDEVCVNCIS